MYHSIFHSIGYLRMDVLLLIKARLVSEICISVKIGPHMILAYIQQKLPFCRGLLTCTRVARYCLVLVSTERAAEARHRNLTRTAHLF